MDVHPAILRMTLGIICFCTAFQNVSSEMRSPYAIVLFFRPQEAPVLTKEDILPFAEQPGSFDPIIQLQQLRANRVSGIYALHQGTIARSDINGQLVLPRLTDDEAVTILITTQITPIILHGTTIDHFELPAAHHAARYACVRTSKGKSARARWTIAKQTPHAFEQIAPDTIVILADPAAVLMIEGEYVTDMSHHLILPDIIVLSSASLSQESARALPLNRFFMPAMPWVAYAPEQYVRSVAQ